MDVTDALGSLRISVVIPAFNASATLGEVLDGIPPFISGIVVVDDASVDDTFAVAQAHAESDSRITVIRHELNRGVGGAMKTGYAKAVEEGADLLAKMDADGQMHPADLPALILPVAMGAADYAKGNRFLRLDAIRRMPWLRLVGNAALSFVAKASSGYWQLMDPTNGYTVISREALGAVDLSAVDDGYFFESSMLTELGLVRAVATDIAVPSRYGNENSHLSVVHSLLTFGPKHFSRFLKRVFYRYLLLDFSAVSILLGLSVPLTAFGAVFGLRAWFHSAVLGVPATAGTVMVAAFTTAGGLFCLVQALVYDIMATPAHPLTLPRLGVGTVLNTPSG